MSNGRPTGPTVQGPANRRALAGLLLVAACGAAVLYYWNSLWIASVDLGLHYAVAARIVEYGHMPTTVDPSLGVMNYYPTLAHTVAAVVGRLLGSVLVGLQLTTLVSFVAIWAGIALMFVSLPRPGVWIACGAAVLELLINRWLIHLELFGNELIRNFFFPQLVAQAAAVLVVTVALYLERRKAEPALRYVVLGVSVPVIAQLHPMPALEVLGVLALLVALDFLHSKDGDRRPLLVIGLLTLGASLILTVLNPTFIALIRNSQNDGVLNLIYTPTRTSLAIESAVVIACSAFLIWRWRKLDAGVAQRASLILKYAGLLGASVAALCLLQAISLALGSGSLYAVKKYAYGLNTILFMDLPLLLVSIPGLVPAHSGDGRESRLASPVGQALPAILVLVSVFSIMPPVSTRLASIDSILPIERFAERYRAPAPGSDSGKYDYAVGLLGRNSGVDYMISIGVLKTPQTRNVDDILAGRLPSKPRLVGRVFTRVGAAGWDIPACRELVTPDGFAILDGACVMRYLQASQP